jgi:hypothetical protein
MWLNEKGIYMEKNIILWVLIFMGTYCAKGQGLITPPNTITGLTHSFRHTFPGGFATVIQDYAAAGQFIQSDFTTTLNGSEMISASFEAPAGEMFVTHAVPDGFGNIELQLYAIWASGPDVGFSPTSTSAVFENLVGPAPSLVSSTDFIGAGGKAVGFDDTFIVAPGTKFTGVDLFAQYASSLGSPTQNTFAPDGFNFIAQTVSDQVLDDNTLMTLEAIPEPSSFLILLGSGVLIYARRRYID